MMIRLVGFGVNDQIIFGAHTKLSFFDHLFLLLPMRKVVAIFKILFIPFLVKVKALLRQLWCLSIVVYNF